jgi:hypothetical protein
MREREIDSLFNRMNICSKNIFARQTAKQVIISRQKGFFVH